MLLSTNFAVLWVSNKSLYNCMRFVLFVADRSKGLVVLVDVANDIHQNHSILPFELILYCTPIHFISDVVVIKTCKKKKIQTLV